MYSIALWIKKTINCRHAAKLNQMGETLMAPSWYQVDTARILVKPWAHTTVQPAPILEHTVFMSKPVLSIGKNRQNDEIETSLPEVGSLSLIHSYVYIYMYRHNYSKTIYIYIFKYPPDVEFISHIYI